MSPVDLFKNEMMHTQTYALRYLFALPKIWILSHLIEQAFFKIWRFLHPNVLGPFLSIIMMCEVSLAHVAKPNAINNIRLSVKLFDGQFRLAPHLRWRASDSSCSLPVSHYLNTNEQTGFEVGAKIL